MSAIRRRAIQGIKIDDTFTVTRTFSEQDVLCFADITRDYNPVHFDERFTEVKKLNGRICHGLLVASILTEIGGQIGWLASGMQFYFIRPVYIQDTITCEFTITEVDQNQRAKAQAVYKNQDGITVMEAELTGILPGPEEQRVLKAIIEETDPTSRAKT